MRNKYLYKAVGICIINYAGVGCRSVYLSEDDPLCTLGEKYDISDIINAYVNNMKKLHDEKNKDNSNHHV